MTWIAHLRSQGPGAAVLVGMFMCVSSLACSVDGGVEESAETSGDGDGDDPSGDGDGDDPSGDGDGDGGGEPPCGGDIVGCDETPTPFELDPSCELEGELEVVVGNGAMSFEPLAPNILPDREFGLQGGQHMWVGVQVQNPALDSPLLRVTLDLSGCRYAEVSCTSAEDWFDYPSRTLVVDADTVAVSDEGYFELFNILYILEGWNWTIPERWRFRVVVEDPCGREGQVSISAIPS